MPTYDAETGVEVEQLARDMLADAKRHGQDNVIARALLAATQEVERLRVLVDKARLTKHERTALEWLASPDRTWLRTLARTERLGPSVARAIGAVQKVLGVDTDIRHAAGVEGKGE